MFRLSLFLILMLIFQINALSIVIPGSIIPKQQITLDAPDSVNYIFSQAKNYQVLHDYTNADEMYKKAIGLTGKNNDSSLYSTFLIFYGEMNYELGDFRIALSNYSEALDYKLQLKEQQYIARLFYNIALLLEIQNKSDEAYQFYYNSLQLFSGLNDAFSCAYCYAGLGNCGFLNQDYVQAEKFYTVADSIHLTLNNQFGIADLAIQIGNKYENDGYLEKALSNYNKSKTISIKLNYLPGIIYSNMCIANIFYMQGNVAKAIKLLEETKIVAQNLCNKYILVALYNILSELYSANKNFEKAYYFYTLYGNGNDSLYTIQGEKELITFILEYQNKKYDQEIKKLIELNRSKEKILKRQKVISISIAIIDIIILGFVVYLERKRRNLLKNNKNISL